MKKKKKKKKGKKEKSTKPLSTSKLQNCFCFTAVGFVSSAAAPIEIVEGKCWQR